MQEALPSQLTVSADTVGGRPVFPRCHLPSDPRAPREARSVTRGCNGTSLSVLGESPPGVALRSGGGHTGEGSSLLPGHLCPWRTPGRSGTWKEGGCARRSFRACGVGSGELDGGCGEWRARRPSGGHRELRDPHNSRRRPLPLRSVPGQSSLTPHPDVWRSGLARRAAPTLLRGPGRSPIAGYTKAAPEAPARPLPRRPRTDQPPLASQSGRPRCQPPALGSPVRRGLLRRSARGPPANPCPPSRPLIGGGGAPGQRPPNNTFASPPPPAA